MKARLILVAGKADKGEVRLKLPTIIGRTREAGLMIAHKTVSRRHCELFERHGMLYVRDSGSLNGTLVDNAPIKESMLKPGHTVTVGPLTFRAEYEPADAFLGGDDPADTVNGTAADHIGLNESNRTAAMSTFTEDFDSGSATDSHPVVSDDALDFGEAEAADEPSLDFGGDETLSMQITEETTDLRSLESPESAPALESIEFEASEASSSGADPVDFGGPATVEEDLDIAFSLDEVDSASTEAVHVESSDDLALDFEESTESAAPVAPAAAASAEDFDLDLAGDDSLELGAGDSTDIDSLPAVAAEDDDAAFDFLADDAADPGPAAAAPAAPAASDEGDEFSFAADDELDFGSPEPATAASADDAVDSFDLGDDDAGTFDLADDSAPATPAQNSAPPAAAADDMLDLGDDEGLTFDLAEPAEEPEPAKTAAKPAKEPAKPAAKGETVEDDEMSDFLKELGM